MDSLLILTRTQYSRFCELDDPGKIRMSGTFRGDGPGLRNASTCLRARGQPSSAHGADAAFDAELCELVDGGGGGLAPSEQAILADTFPPEKRGQAFAMYGLAVVCAP